MDVPLIQKLLEERGNILFEDIEDFIHVLVNMCVKAGSSSFLKLSLSDKTDIVVDVFNEYYLSTKHLLTDELNETVETLLNHPNLLNTMISVQLEHSCY